MGNRSSKVTVVRGGGEESAPADAAFRTALGAEFASSKHRASGRIAWEQQNLSTHSRDRDNEGEVLDDRDSARERDSTSSGGIWSSGLSGRKSRNQGPSSRGEKVGAREPGGVPAHPSTPSPEESQKLPTLCAYQDIGIPYGNQSAPYTSLRSQADTRTSGTGSSGTLSSQLPKPKAPGASSKNIAYKPGGLSSMAAVPTVVAQRDGGIPAANGRAPQAPPPQPAAGGDTAANAPSEAGTAAAPAVDAVQWVIRPGPPVESVYKVGKVLGQGSFGVVRGANHLVTGLEVAIKTIRKSLLRAADVSSLRREVEILHHLSGHPHISQLLGVFEEPRQLHLVLELYKGGDLFDAIIGVGRHSERTAADVMRTVLTAISYCHAMGVAHRDIKPENFMLTADTPKDGQLPKAPIPVNPKDPASLVGLGARMKLIDFGLSTFCTDDTPLAEIVGTSYYVAPEVLDGRYSLAADVWSAGVILHIMLTGYAPFDGRDDKEILRSVRKGKLDLSVDPTWKSISPEATAVVLAMLERDPKKRATADQVLSMPWLGRTPDACVAPSTPLPGVVSERMRRFARMNSFKKEARRVVAGLMRPEEVAGLVAQFRGLDADRDGRISMDELKDGLARQALLGGSATGAAPLSEKELRDLLHRSDLNGDGLLDESEFLGAVLPATAIARQALAAAAAASRPTSARGNAIAAAFAHFDTDGSGFITPDELRKALAMHHPSGKGPDIEALLSRHDRDADGRISYSEFLDMLVQDIDDDDDMSDVVNGGKGADSQPHQSWIRSQDGEARRGGMASRDAAAAAWGAGGREASADGGRRGGGGAAVRGDSAAYSRTTTVAVQPPSGLASPLDWSDECQYSDGEDGNDMAASFAAAANRMRVAGGQAAQRAAGGSGSAAATSAAVASSFAAASGPRPPSRLSQPQQRQLQPQASRDVALSAGQLRLPEHCGSGNRRATVAGFIPYPAENTQPTNGGLYKVTEAAEQGAREEARRNFLADHATSATQAARPASRAPPPPRLQLPAQPVADMRSRRHSAGGVLQEGRIDSGCGSPVLPLEPRTPMSSRAAGSAHPGIPDVAPASTDSNNTQRGVAAAAAAAAGSLPGSPSAASAAALAQRVMNGRSGVGGPQRSPQSPLSPTRPQTNHHQQQAGGGHLPNLQHQSGSPDGDRPAAVPAGSFGWGSLSPSAFRASRAAAAAAIGLNPSRHSLHLVSPSVRHAAAAQQPITPSAPLPMLPSSHSRSRRQSTGSPAWPVQQMMPLLQPQQHSSPLSPRVPQPLGETGAWNGRRSRRATQMGMEDMIITSRASVDLDEEINQGMLPPGATGCGMPRLQFGALATSASGRML